MPGIPSTGGSSIRGLLRKSREPKPEAPNPKPNDDVKPAPREAGSDTASLDGRTLTDPQQGTKHDLVQPYFGRGRDADKLSRSDYKNAKKDTKENNPELYEKGVVQRRNADGDVTHEITRPGYEQTGSGRIIKDDSYSGTASRHKVLNTMTGGAGAGVMSAYRSMRPRPQEMIDGGAAAKSQNLKIAGGLGAVAVVGGGGYYVYTQNADKDPLNPSANNQNPSSLPPGTVAPSQMAGYSGPTTQSHIGGGPVQIPPTASGTGGYTQINY